jgi:DNA-binding transcriptional MerR regulator
MKALSGKKYTARELAAQFGCSVKTIHNHANALFGPVEKGFKRARLFDEAQATAILESIKASTETGRPVGNSKTIEKVLQTQETPLSPILQLKILQEQMSRIYEAEIARLKSEKTSLEAAYGREVLDHRATKGLLTERESELETYQRIAEAGGLSFRTGRMCSTPTGGAVMGSSLYQRGGRLWN